MPYCTISVGEGPTHMIGVSIPLADLELNDDVLVARIDAEASVAGAQRPMCEAVVSAAATSVTETRYPAESSSVVAQPDRLWWLLGRQADRNAVGAHRSADVEADFDRAG